VDVDCFIETRNKPLADQNTRLILDLELRGSDGAVLTEGALQLPLRTDIAAIKEGEQRPYRGHAVLPPKQSPRSWRTFGAVLWGQPILVRSALDFCRSLADRRHAPSVPCSERRWLRPQERALSFIVLPLPHDERR
jgi:hypothetical protein